jgi:hypothetical protein
MPRCRDHRGPPPRSRPYLTFVPDPGEQFTSKALFPGAGNGLKQRLRDPSHDF